MLQRLTHSHVGRAVEGDRTKNVVNELIGLFCNLRPARMRYLAEK